MKIKPCTCRQIGGVNHNGMEGEVEKQKTKEWVKLKDGSYCVTWKKE